MLDHAVVEDHSIPRLSEWLVEQAVVPVEPLRGGAAGRVAQPPELRAVVVTGRLRHRPQSALAATWRRPIGQASGS